MVIFHSYVTVYQRVVRSLWQSSSWDLPSHTSLAISAEALPELGSFPRPSRPSSTRTQIQSSAASEAWHELSPHKSWEATRFSKFKWKHWTCAFKQQTNGDVTKQTLAFNSFKHWIFGFNTVHLLRNNGNRDLVHQQIAFGKNTWGNVGMQCN